MVCAEEPLSYAHANQMLLNVAAIGGLASRRALGRLLVNIWQEARVTDFLALFQPDAGGSGALTRLGAAPIPPRATPPS